MSITSELRGYADTAVSQGRHLVEQAQAQLNEVAGTVNDLTGDLRDKVAGVAKENVSGLRCQAEKAVNLEALKAAVEPYLEQARGYRAQVGERAEGLVSKALELGKSDPRVAKALQAAGSVATATVRTVQDRVVTPLQGLRSGKPAARKAAPRPASKPATAAPAGAPASKPSTRKPAAKAVRKSTTRPSAQA
ncbi:MAG: hypothetical protein EPN43_03065 [Jatrophihabitans sp.]|nr:MAG: hypothetical protein EPN43_03065 [Jatrophihabitans sp.]